MWRGVYRAMRQEPHDVSHCLVLEREHAHIICACAYKKVRWTRQAVVYYLGLRYRRREMRGLCIRLFFAVLFGVGVAGCGKVPAVPDGGSDATSMPDAPGCTANALSCGTDDALYQCDPSGSGITKIEDCQYGCADDHCKECAANTTFCSSDDLVMCDASGMLTNPQTCANGCQMDRCNTCRPGVAYCNGANAVTCGLDGLPGASQDCGAPGCTSGVCNSCVANTTTCQGDNLVVCNAGGTVASATPCALGCSSSGSPHCRTMTPMFGVQRPSGTLPDLLIDANATLDISNCSNTPNSVTLTIGTASTSIVGSPQIARATQALGRPICIVRFNKITIAAGFTLNIVNDTSLGHVLSLQATGDVQINGTLSFANTGSGPAPGVTVDAIATGSGYTAPGAGGGGAARAGGNGGACNGCAGTNTPGGGGGAAITTIDSTLTSGSAGGSVMNGLITYGAGGAGGGAIHLVSLTRVVMATTGRIVLNGKGAIGNVNVRSMGAGGGSGGSLVIEAPMLSMSMGSIAVANGGGGAGGCPVCMGDFIPVCDNADGEHGQLSAMRAAGGDCMGAGTGGYEATGVTTPPANGANGDSSGFPFGGGGGGSSGFIILRGRAAANVMIPGGAVVSPPPTIGAVTAN